MSDYLYTLIIDIKKSETTHIDVKEHERVLYLKKIAETIATLPREEYLIVGMDF